MLRTTILRLTNWMTASSVQARTYKLEVCKECKGDYKEYRNTLEEAGEKQISLTDPDVRLMKSNEGFSVGYNAQTAVDPDSHMIVGFLISNNSTDHGQITSVVTKVKNDYDVEILETAADKEDECPGNHAENFTSGIVSNMIQRDGSCREFGEFEYLASEITDKKIE